MISIEFVFWVLVVFFAFAGSMRGWRKEMIALTGMISAMAILANYGYLVLTRLTATMASDPGGQQTIWIWAQIIFFSLFAFFGYQVVGPMASARLGGRLGGALGATLERQFIGFLFGGINGYMLVGGLWGFLEYRLTELGYQFLAPNTPYPFSTEVITRPPFEEGVFNLVTYLPQGLGNPTFWLIMFFVAFVFILVALI